ncbi:hypothetical protein JNL27_08670 [bacterium]|nr:hypothetical protein [bacterium]
MKKPASVISALFIALVALGHLLRIILNIDLIVGGIQAPVWASGVAAVFCGVLATLLWNERRG